MPNWCYNSLHVSGPQEDINRWKERATSEDSPLDLNKLYPMPPDVLASLKRPWQDENGKLIGDPPGGPLWYNWSIENWGTKWNLGKDVDVSESPAVEGGLPASIHYMFDSAWCPPVGAIDNAVKDFPTLTFKMLYEELGCGFVGRYHAVNGEGTDESKDPIIQKCSKCKEGDGEALTFCTSLIGCTTCDECGDDYSPDDAEELYFGETL